MVSDSHCPLDRLSGDYHPKHRRATSIPRHTIYRVSLYVNRVFWSWFFALVLFPSLCVFAFGLGSSLLSLLLVLVPCFCLCFWSWFLAFVFAFGFGSFLVSAPHTLSRKTTVVRTTASLRQRKQVTIKFWCQLWTLALLRSFVLGL